MLTILIVVVGWLLPSVAIADAWGIACGTVGCLIPVVLHIANRKKWLRSNTVKVSWLVWGVFAAVATALIFQFWVILAVIVWTLYAILEGYFEDKAPTGNG